MKDDKAHPPVPETGADAVPRALGDTPIQHGAVDGIAPDPWSALRALTPARIALGRAGQGMPTAELLRFGMAHAQARDAVQAPFDAPAIAADLARLGIASLEVASQAPDRNAYLRRPDLGRRLAPSDRAALAALPRAEGKVVLVVADGLCATAAQLQAVPLIDALRQRLEDSGLPAAWPVVLAHQARVALGDDIASARGAAAVVVLIGERPGLSSPDSLGAYITWAPRVGCLDSQRNCLSNIRAAGMPVAEAANRIAWLLQEARFLGATGVALKDESEVRLPRLGAG